MPVKLPWTENELNEAIALFREGMTSGEVRQILREKGYPERTLAAVNNKRCEFVASGHIERVMAARPVVEKAPTANRPIEQLLNDLIESHARKVAHHQAKRTGLSIEMPDAMPYGIAFLGDPHLGDSGCNLTRMMADMTVVRETDGLHAINMGDLTNNWIGNLSRLYAKQESTDDDEEALIRWLLEQTDWLAVILGNHDKWTKVAELLCKDAGVRYVSHGSVFKVYAGESVLKIDARHTHRGHSQYNPAFGQAKQNYRGSDAHIVVGAHTHTSAYTMLRNGVSGHLGHAIRVGSYKEADEYADANGFAEDTIGPSCMAVVQPEHFGATGFVQIFWDMEQGADYLTHLRLQSSPKS